MGHVLRTTPAVIFVALLCACLAQPALAQWKWRDKNGQITVSDLPPPRDVADKDVLQRPDPSAALRPVSAASAASAPPLAKPPVDAELTARKKASDQEQSARAKADSERLTQQRQDNCRSARSHLTAMDSGQRIARINDKGEREILDDRQRAEEVRRAREVIASDCR
jgi:hypothetical protein